MSNYHPDDFKSSSAIATSGLNSFVTETQLDERRKKRQEEWEKVRKPDDPLEAPEEVYDPRPLFERLQEQKTKKQEEYEESKKLKHLIRGLDNDEISFLEMVDNTKMELESKIWKEEMKEIEEYKKAVAHLSQEEQENKLKEFKNEILKSINNKKMTDGKKTKKSNPLVNIVKKRNQQDDSSESSIKKLKSDIKEDTNNINTNDNNDLTKDSNHQPKCVTDVNNDVNNDLAEDSNQSKNVDTIKCIGILPGLRNYLSDSSSDSENSSISDNDEKDFNLISRVSRSNDVKSQQPQK